MDDEDNSCDNIIGVVPSIFDDDIEFDDTPVGNDCVGVNIGVDGDNDEDEMAVLEYKFDDDDIENDEFIDNINERRCTSCASDKIV